MCAEKKDKRRTASTEPVAQADSSTRPDLWEEDDREAQLLDAVRGERDPHELRRWATVEHVPVVLAVIESPLADESVLDLIDTPYDVVNLALIKHPRCPPTVYERLSVNPSPRVRDALDIALKERPGLAQGRDQAGARTGRWHAQVYSTEVWLGEMKSDPDAHSDDIKYAMYERSYGELFFDLSDNGKRAYLNADPFDEGFDPPFLLERIAAQHPRSPHALIDRIAQKLVITSERMGTLQVDAQRRRRDGTLHEIPDTLKPLLRVLGPLIMHREVAKRHLRGFAEASIPEIQALVALSPRAPLPTLKRLVARVATVASVAAHPSRKVRDVQKDLLGAGEGVRAILAANPYATQWAIQSIWKDATPLELAGLAANPALSEKELHLLAGPLYAEEVHLNVAANLSAPTTRLEAWAGSDNARLRAAVAANTATPSAALEELARSEREPHVLRELGRNPSLPLAAMEVLVGRKQLLGLAANPNVPATLQEIIADTGDREVRLRLARNVNTVPHLLLRLVDPATDWGQVITTEESILQVRIGRAVSRHPHAPPEAIEYLATSNDPETWAAVQIANL